MLAVAVANLEEVDKRDTIGNCNKQEWEEMLKYYIHMILENKPLAQSKLSKSSVFFSFFKVNGQIQILSNTSIETTDRNRVITAV